MTDRGLTELPHDYPVFYSGNLDEWMTHDEFRSDFPRRFSSFIMGNYEEKMLVAFTSSKLSKTEGGHAVIFAYVGVIGDDAYLRGVKKIGTFKEPPNWGNKNEAYIHLLSHEDAFAFPYGWRYYAGESNDMKWIREVIEGWMQGLINKTGSTPDYEEVRAF